MEYKEYKKYSDLPDPENYVYVYYKDKFHYFTNTWQAMKYCFKHDFHVREIHIQRSKKGKPFHLVQRISITTSLF